MNAIILVNAGGGSAGEDGAARVDEALRKAGIHGDVEEVEGASSPSAPRRRSRRARGWSSRRAATAR